jgi:hypothetical protein
MFTCEELGYHTTTLKFIPAHNLPTEFQEWFHKRIHYMWPCSVSWNTKNHTKILIWPLTTTHYDLSLIKVFLYTF